MQESLLRSPPGARVRKGAARLVVALLSAVVLLALSPSIQPQRPTAEYRKTPLPNVLFSIYHEGSDSSRRVESGAVATRLLVSVRQSRQQERVQGVP